jgi:hypothetical protein
MLQMVIRDVIYLSNRWWLLSSVVCISLLNSELGISILVKGLYDREREICGMEVLLCVLFHRHSVQC